MSRGAGIEGTPADRSRRDWLVVTRVARGIFDHELDAKAGRTWREKQVRRKHDDRKLRHCLLQMMRERENRTVRQVSNSESE